MGLLLSDSSALREWILHAPHVPDGGPSFVRELCRRLRSLGLPLWRMSVALLTKHPEVLWRTVQWHEDEGVQVLEREHRTSLEPFFTQSPVALLVHGSPSIRVRLTDEAVAFPICRDLQEQGGTEYYAQGLKFTNGETSYVSWATRHPQGFGDEMVRTLDAIAPSLARRVELESAYHATRTLLGVYLGRNAARRVLDGAFKRGGGELIHAAIWFCDLRNFTPMSDRMEPHEVVEVLDAYFDRVAGAVAARGGEVLKFIGDAVLAIFPVGADATSACRNALIAAEEALASLQSLNESRPVHHALAIGVALHLGEVMYGNIGSRERLDFTVISSSVNEACRLEALCKVLKTPLTLSEAFVGALGGEDIVDLGEHDLKGVTAKVRVFTLGRHRPAVAARPPAAHQDTRK
jgi:adenylate cyclase